MLIVGLVWHLFRVRRRKRQWSALAAELGLEATEEGLRLDGNLGAHRVSVWIITRRGTRDGPFTDRRGGNTRFYTAVRTELFNPLGTELEVRPEGLGSKLRKAVGKGDVEIGDPGFDRSFWVTAEDAESARAVLHPEVRSELQRYRELDDDFTLERNAITSIGRGYARPERLRELLEGQGRVVEALRRTGGARG